MSKKCFYKKFKANRKDIHKSQDIATLTFESSFWLEQKAAIECEGSLRYYGLRLRAQ